MYSGKLIKKTGILLENAKKVQKKLAIRNFLYICIRASAFFKPIFLKNLNE